MLQTPHMCINSAQNRRLAVQNRDLRNCMPFPQQHPVDGLHPEEHDHHRLLDADSLDLDWAPLASGNEIKMAEPSTPGLRNSRNVTIVVATTHAENAQNTRNSLLTTVAADHGDMKMPSTHPLWRKGKPSKPLVVHNLSTA